MSDLEARKRGDTYADEFILKSKRTKQPIDITGFSFKLTVNTKAAPTASDPPEFQIDGTITDGPNGKVEFAPTDADVDRVGKFYYDIQMVDAAGRKRTLVSGRYVLTQDITKD